MKKLTAAILVGIMTLGSLTGCGLQGTSETTETSEAAVSQTMQKDIDSEEKTGDGKVSAPKQKGVKISTIEGPITLFLPQSSSTGDRWFASPAVESLGRLAEDGTTQPWLAEEFITDPDALTFTIKLRDGIVFHDGSVCDAEAVAWNIGKYIENGKSAEIGNPADVTVDDNLTVTVHFNEWANNWDTVIGEIYILSKEAYEKNGEEWCKIHCVGTGPFLFDSYTAGTSLKYVKNDNYRLEGMPYVDSVEFVVLSDTNTQVSAFLNGETDILNTINGTVIQTVMAQGFKNVGRESANIANIKYALFNSKNPDHPTGDLKVRQAIMHCIDWDNVAKALSGGLGEASNQFATKDSWAYNPNVEFYEYNLDIAKQLLADAGYPNGFETTIYTIARDNDTAVALQAALAQINIQAEVKVIDNSVMASMQKEDDIDGIVIGKGAGQMDFTNNYIRLYSSEGIKNHGIMLRPKEYEDALFGARAAKTLDEKKELLQQASKMLVQDYVMLFPMSVLYNYSFSQKGLVDTGMYYVSLTQWTPEAMHWE
ncbi:MAG: ABC transporter substrate-binding protein [Lachnospiraceae bacterium]